MAGPDAGTLPPSMRRGRPKARRTGPATSRESWYGMSAPFASTGG